MRRNLRLEIASKGRRGRKDEPLLISVFTRHMFAPLAGTHDGIGTDWTIKDEAQMVSPHVGQH